MITEDYVSFEIAKLLKEKGFDESTSMVYMSYGDLCKCTRYDSICNSNYNDITKNYFECTAPTLQRAMKWLRKVHGIHIQACCPVIDLEVNITGVKYNVVISNLKDYCIAFDTDIEDNEYDSPEEACEAAIMYCLENLI